MRGFALTLSVVALLHPIDRIQSEVRPVASMEELEAALKLVKPGDEVLLRAGEWRDVDLRIEAAGTQERPVVVRAERAGETVVTGNSRVRIAGRHVTVSGLLFREAFHPDAVLEFRRDSKRLASRCRVMGCAFIDCNPPEGSREDAKYLSIYGDNNRVDHCTFSGKRSVGTTLVVWLTGEEPGRHRIDSNHFGPRPELGRNGGETIRIGDSKTSHLNARCVVEGNLFEECNGEAEIVSNKSCENVYRRNTFLRCSGALTLRHGHRCIVEGNVFLGEGARGAGGVRIIGEDHRVVNNYFEALPGKDARAAISLISGIKDGPPEGYSPVLRARVAYNTIIDCRESLLIGFGDRDVKATVAPRKCVIANNLVTSRHGPLVRALTPTADFTWSGNLLHGAEAGIETLGDALTHDPRLMRDAAPLMRPQANSPTVDAADAGAASVEFDIDGQRRGARPDIGCDEVSDGAVTRPPVLKRENVGPSWIEDRRSSE